MTIFVTIVLKGCGQIDMTGCFSKMKSREGRSVDRLSTCGMEMEEQENIEELGGGTGRMHLLFIYSLTRSLTDLLILLLAQLLFYLLTPEGGLKSAWSSIRGDVGAVVPIGNVEDNDVHKRNMQKPLTNIQSRELNPNRYQEAKCTTQSLTYLTTIYYLVQGGRF